MQQEQPKEEEEKDEEHFEGEDEPEISPHEVRKQSFAQSEVPPIQFKKDDEFEVIDPEPEKKINAAVS